MTSAVKNRFKMDKEPKILEREAYSFLSQEKHEEAFGLFARAAKIYRDQGNRKQSTLCFASAASCWSKKSGEKTFHNAAISYEEAAKEAVRCRDLEYASMLYKYAAINHERDGDLLNFSDCFYLSKEYYRNFLTYSLVSPNKIDAITKTAEEKGIKGFFKRAFLWLMLTFSCIIWGHGERPARTLFTGILVVFLSAALYGFGYLVRGGVIIRPDFLEAFYQLVCLFFF